MEMSQRFPLASPRSLQLLREMTEHPQAPLWNHVAGDRLTASSLRAVQVFSQGLEQRRLAPGLPGWLIEWLNGHRDKIPLLRAHVPREIKSDRDWLSIRTCSRAELAQHPEWFVPDDADLDAMMVYRTAGTTGHALLVPHHPVAVASYQVMLSFALRRHGVVPAFHDARVACFLVGAQRNTVTYPSVLSTWNGAGFAKLNLHDSAWQAEGDAQRYFDAFPPFFCTGDPISFATMLKQGIQTHTAALVTTAVGMSQGLKLKLEAAYRCPVIDWYSLTETGPLGYGCPHGQGYHVISDDIYIEVLDREGSPCAYGELGEITVSGGRNPYVPLLRYRTGDWGRLDASPCSCGDTAPRLVELEGREPVLLKNDTGGVVNPIDISRLLREFAIVQHELVQHRDGSVDLTLRPVTFGLDKAAIRTVLAKLFGGATPLSIREDFSLGDRSTGKVLPYRSEFLLED